MNQSIARISSATLPNLMRAVSSHAIHYQILAPLAQYILLMQENRFTYSPAINPLPKLPSFQEFQARTSVPVSYDATQWIPQTTYTPPTFTSKVTVPNAPLYAPYSSTLPANRQITFGAPTLQGSTDANRITLNQGNTTAFVPAYSEAARPVVAVEEGRRPVLYAPQPANEGVIAPIVDTTEFKYVREDEFKGCFHCFTPVTFDTKGKKKLCG